MLLKNLPVADPNTLVRLGSNWPVLLRWLQWRPDRPNYSNFSTDTYQQLKKNVPEFAELAAMQAGFTFRPIVARRDDANTEAHSVMGEFVSGSYFTTFGLRPTVGKLVWIRTTSPLPT